jgi:hypothetical protein
LMSAFGGKADFARRCFDHFQHASLTRYDAFACAFGGGDATTRFHQGHW